jgi:sugar lactone lactonase YvrE
LVGLACLLLFTSQGAGHEMPPAVATSPAYYHFLTSFGSSGHGPEQFRQPKAMAFSRDGTRLAICDTGNHRVIVLRVHLPSATGTAGPTEPTGTSAPSAPPPPPSPPPPPPRPEPDQARQPDEFFAPDLDEIFGPSAAGPGAGAATTPAPDAQNADPAHGGSGSVPADDGDLGEDPFGTGTFPPDGDHAEAAPAATAPGKTTPEKTAPIGEAGEAREPDQPPTPAIAPASPAAADSAEPPGGPTAPGAVAGGASPAVPPGLGVPSFTVEVVLGGLWPYEGSLEPADWPDRFREPDHADGLRPPRAYSGRPYHGGQARIRPWYNVPMDRFHYPQGVAWLDQDTLLVSDTENHRLKAVTLAGEVRFILGQEGWKDGYFHQPLGVAVDCEQNIYVVEPRSKYIRGLGLDFAQRQRVQGNRLQIFAPDGKFKRRLGHMHRLSGRDLRQFKDLTRVCVTKDRLYLADNGNHRVLVFDQDLNPKEELAAWPFYRLRYPNGIHDSLDGRIAIADTGNHTVLIVGPAPERKLLQIVGGFGTQRGRFSQPWEAHFGPGGDLYVLDTMNCRLQVFRGPSSKEYERCPKPPPPPPPPPPAPPPPPPPLPPPASPAFSF